MTIQIDYTLHGGHTTIDFISTTMSGELCLPEHSSLSACIINRSVIPTLKEIAFLHSHKEIVAKAEVRYFRDVGSKKCDKATKVPKSWHLALLDNVTPALGSKQRFSTCQLEATAP